MNNPLILNNSRTLKRTLVGLIFCFLGLQLCPNAEAGNNQCPYKKTDTEVASEFKTQSLSRYEQLPDVPQYSGQTQFLNGVLSPNARGGVQITYNLAARESKQAVIQWYQEALKMYRWELVQVNSSTLSVRKGGNFLNVMVAPANRAGMQSDIMLSFRTTAGR